MKKLRQSVSGEIRFDFAKKSKQSCILNRAKKP